MVRIFAVAAREYLLTFEQVFARSLGCISRSAAGEGEEGATIPESCLECVAVCTEYC